MRIASLLRGKGDFVATVAPMATVAEVVERLAELGVGALVVSGDGVTIDFVVYDGGARTPVRFRGIPPDLFKENSGVVAEGAFDNSGLFLADTILAKHDERYMPPELTRKDGQVEHKTESLQQ